MSSPQNRLLSLLKDSGIEYQMLTHPPCRTSVESQAARAAAGWPQAIGAKALIVRPERNVDCALLVLPGSARLDNAAVRRAIGPFRFATPDEVREAADGLEIGTIPPFGAPVLPGVSQLIVDRSLLSDHAVLGFNAASLTTSIVLAPDAYASLPLGMSVLDIARPAG